MTAEPLNVPGAVRASAKRRRADRASGIIIALAMLAAVALVGQRIWIVATGPLPPGPGIRAPAFAADTPDGEHLELSAYRGQVVLVDFWATWCPPCVHTMPTLEQMHESYRGEGLVVLGVNQEAGAERKVARFMKDRNLHFSTVMDDGTIARRFGVYTFPTSFLVGRDGVILRTYRGIVSVNQLREDIEEALSDDSA